MRYRVVPSGDHVVERQRRGRHSHWTEDSRLQRLVVRAEQIVRQSSIGHPSCIAASRHQLIVVVIGRAIRGDERQLP